jgi:hypothetical protein
MTDTLWSDISEFQVPVNNSYPYHFLCLRSNDGSYQDHHFTQNIAWARAALKSGHLWGYMVYYFYRPGFDGAKLLMQRVGKPDSRMVAMIDVESANGQVTGNQSAEINAQHDELAHWLGSASRVVGYGNVTDLNDLWPQKPAGIRIIVAAYGSNPGYPGKYAHQYEDNANTPPFGPSDLNSADGMTVGDLEKMYGFVQALPPGEQVFDGKTTMGEVAKSRNYPTTGAWIAHQQALSATDAEHMLSVSVPPAGTKWHTNA